MQPEASTPAASTIAFAAQFVQVPATFATLLHREPRARTGRIWRDSARSGNVLWFLRVVPLSDRQPTRRSLYSGAMRAIGIALVVGLTVACSTPYTPTPLPPIPSPTPTPTPSPAPPPVAVQPFTLSMYVSPTPETGKTVNLILITSSEPRSPYTVVWTFGDGGTASTVDVNQTKHAYLRSGTITARADLRDAAGRRASTELEITVADPPPPPTIPPAPPPQQSYAVAITANPTTVLIGDPVTVTATVVPLNGAPSPTAFFWDCTNNGTFDQTTTGPTSTCTYSTVGLKTVRGVASSATASGVGTTSVLVTP